MEKKKNKVSPCILKSDCYASSCCGTGVRFTGRGKSTKCYECLLCGNSCDIEKINEKGCCICKGPLSMNIKCGKPYEYCPIHG